MDHRMIPHCLEDTKKDPRIRVIGRILGVGSSKQGNPTKANTSDLWIRMIGRSNPCLKKLYENAELNNSDIVMCYACYK